MDIAADPGLWRLMSTYWKCYGVYFQMVWSHINFFFELSRIIGTNRLSYAGDFFYFLILLIDISKKYFRKPNILTTQCCFTPPATVAWQEAGVTG